MNVQRYLFQSPYNGQVQVGRPDFSSPKEVETQTQATSSASVNVSSQAQPVFIESQTVTETEAPSENTVELTKLLDVYV